MDVASAMKKVMVMENPLAMSDEQVLEQVCHFYVGKGSEPFNVEAFFRVVSAIMKRAIGVADPSIKSVEVEKFVPTNIEPPTQLLKHLCCQMMETRDDEYHISAHKTTISILEQLKAYSWDAKAVTALAAFSLEYGNFWHLAQVPKEDNLGTSLALLNHVQAFERSRKDIYDYNLVVRNVYLTVENIVKLEYMLTQNYDERNMPTLAKAMRIFPAFVYWTILTIVACASHIDLLLGYAGGKYELSNISSKISTVLLQTRDLLTKLESEKAWMEEYQVRVRVVIQTPTEIVQVLKYMLFPLDLINPQFYHGLTGKMVSIEEFRHKYVVMLISGMYSIGDEIRLLKLIYDYLQTDPKEVKGFRKEDFKILWVPIVDDIKEINSVEQGKLFLDWRSTMDWYVMDPRHIPTVCKKLIREKLGFQDDPMVPVFNPQGRRINNDALHMMFVWDGSAFPWRPEDDGALSQKWNWLWVEMRRMNSEIDEWIKKDRYIFIYGRGESDSSSNQFLVRFPEVLEGVKRDDVIQKADVFINHYHYGKGTVGEEYHVARGFWSYVEAMFHNMKKKATQDRAFDEVKDILGLRLEPSGWVLLSKGSNITQVCRADLAYQTLVEFDAWKVNIQVDPSFDVSFRRYYDLLAAKLPPHTRCLHLELRSHLGDISGSLECVRCRRHMAMEMVRYVCCHHDALQPEESPDAGYVAIDRKI